MMTRDETIGAWKLLGEIENEDAKLRLAYVPCVISLAIGVMMMAGAYQSRSPWLAVVGFCLYAGAALGNFAIMCRRKKNARRRRKFFFHLEEEHPGFQSNLRNAMEAMGILNEVRLGLLAQRRDADLEGLAEDRLVIAAVQVLDEKRRMRRNGHWCEEGGCWQDCSANASWKRYRRFERALIFFSLREPGTYFIFERAREIIDIE